MESHPRLPRRTIALACLNLLLASAGWTQTPAVDAVTLARFDKNKNGIIDPTEAAAMDAAQSNKAVVQTTSGIAKEEPVLLSPFEVVTDNKGYYAGNTLSGTRFNSKLEDLGLSMTIVTKEQMIDFGMLDINDVFNYTAGTEGTGTFTDFTVDRNGSVSDNVQLNPAQANRVRGLSSANISLGNVETSGRTPVDPLGIDGLEISRGPNSTIFGNGSPSGSVNLIPASANLSRNRSQFVLRGDSYGGYRTSVDLNRVVKKGVLAFRVNGAFQHDAFERKPSGVNSVRYNGMVKYQPFKTTTITGAYSIYRMNGNRPNFSPPRDNVSYWLRSGRPGWDPVAQVIHVSGTTLGPFLNDNNIPDYLTRGFYGAKSGQTLGEWYIGPGGLEYWSAQGNSINGTNPESGATGPRLFSSNSVAGAVAGLQAANQPLFASVPTVSDKSLYDWESINLASVNRVMDRTLIKSAQLDQVLLNTTRHTVALQLSYHREDSERYKRNLIGTANDNGLSGQLFVDVNERHLDGTPNPYFGRPYIGVAQPWTQWQPLRYETTRAQLAYKLDLSRERNWLRWFGTHQFSGYDEFKYRTSRTRTYRDAIVDNHSWIPAGLSRGNGNIFSTRGYTRFYVGDNVGSNVDYAPSDFAYGTYPFVWGNFTTGAINREPSQLGLVAVTASTSGNKTILKTAGGVVQSHFLNDRLVTTFGMRQDRFFTKSGAPAQLNPDGITHSDSVTHWAVGDYTNRFGKTRQGGVVVRPFRGLGFVKRMDKGSPATHFLGELINSLSLSYNESDSFSPTDLAQDILLRILPNARGLGKDYGIGFHMFDNKFVLRINKFETLQLGISGGDANTLSRRVLRYDVPNPADEPVFMLYYQASAWTKAQHPTWTDAQVDDEVAKVTGIPIATRLALDLQDPGLNARNNQLSKGYEVELNFNPTRYWTLAASGTDTRSYVSGAGTALAEWIDMRMPLWTTIKDPRGADRILGTPDDANPVNWWTTNYGGPQTPAQNYAINVGAPFSLLRQQEGKAKTQLRRYNAKLSTKFDLAGYTEHRIAKRFNVGGSVRWADRAAIGYYGLQSLPAPITELDGSRPIYDKAQYYVDAFVSYRTKLWSDRIGATFQLNARNIQEGGRLQPIGVDPDGTPKTYRIIDPRQFILTATFDF